MTREEAFWQGFLKETGLDPQTPCCDTFSFGMDRQSANDLLALVLEGKKRATSSSLLGYQAEGEPIPQAGAYSVVTDSDGEPYCVIRTDWVEILPFREVTFEKCSLEGEDTCLESWQANHEAFFRGEGAEIGYTFTPEMPVVFEHFSVVYRKNEK